MSCHENYLLEEQIREMSEEAIAKGISEKELRAMLEFNFQIKNIKEKEKETE